MRLRAGPAGRIAEVRSADPSGSNAPVCAHCYQESRALHIWSPGLKMPWRMSNVVGMNEKSAIYDIAVVGGGPAGLATAIAAAQSGAKTALIARRSPYADNRTTALLGGSIDFLQRLEVWQSCKNDAAELRVMRLVDDTGRLIRAPEVRFCCDEIGLDAFGYNIENRALVSALEHRAANLAGLTQFDDEAAAINSTEDAVSVELVSATPLSARLVVGADGRHSLCREAAGIAVRHRDLHQAALTFNVGHSRPHRNISTEFHTPHGPCVFVPLPGDRSSVVWVSEPKEAERLMALSDEELSDAAEARSHSILGNMRVEPGRSRYPLVIEQPVDFAKARIALVGEAAHVLPPIGAQGLNMGLRDAADIVDIVRDALAAGEDPGSSAVLGRYASARRPDVMSRTFAIDIANRSLLSAFLPMQSLRAAGLHLIGSFGPLRRLAMREGLAPSWRSSPVVQAATETPAARSE